MKSIAFACEYRDFSSNEAMEDQKRESHAGATFRAANVTVRKDTRDTLRKFRDNRNYGTVRRRHAYSVIEVDI